MKNKESIKLKAAFLLTVFALNMVVAFACSMGLDMGFNKKHHHDENEVQVSSKHSHHHSQGTAHRHEHNAGIASHHHQEETSDKDGCCNDKAIKFQQVDKSLNRAANPIIKAPVFIAFMSAFIGLEIKNDSLNLVHKSIIPQYYPPPDIRIVIQSFQI